MAATSEEKEEKPRYVPNRMIVKFKDTLTQCPHCLLKAGKSFKNATTDQSASLDALILNHHVKEIKPLFRSQKEEMPATADTIAYLKGKEQDQIRQTQRRLAQSNLVDAASFPETYHIYTIELPENSNVEKVVEDFTQDAHVDYAQPDYMYEANFIPNDPRYPELWGLSRMQMEQAWDLTKGQGVVVAVVDSGVDYNHPDISANIWTNPGEIPANGIDDDHNGYTDDVRGWDFAYSNNDTMDRYGHGTHVAGTIAAANNGAGIIGVAPEAKIMIVKSLSDTGPGSSSSLANGLVYAAQNGAKIINNSWGQNSRNYFDYTIEVAANTAYALGAALIFAAGNSSDDVQYYWPAASVKTIKVSATDSNDVKASFSNYGALLDVAAPGVDILSLGLSNNYVSNYGTSMAAPHVSGLAALIKSRNPAFTNEDIRRVLRASADDVGTSGFDVNTGYGRINAARAVVATQALRSIITSPVDQSLLNPSIGTLTITGIADGPYTLSYQEVGTTNPPWLTIGTYPNPVNNGTLGLWDLQTLDPSKDYRLRLQVPSPDGHGISFDHYVYLNAYDPVVKQITNTTTFLAFFGISGNKIVWRASSGKKINLYDVLTRNQTFITTTDDSAVNVAISGNIVAWRESFSGAQKGIYVYDISTGQKTRISSVDTAFTMDGDYMAWLVGNQVTLYNINTHQQQQIPTNITNAEGLSLAGDKMYWWLRQGNDMQFYFYNISSASTGNFVISNVGNYQGTFNGFKFNNDKVLWIEYNSGVSNLFLYDRTSQVKMQMNASNQIPQDAVFIGTNIAWAWSATNFLSSGYFLHHMSTHQNETFFFATPSVGAGQNIKASGRRLIGPDMRDGSTQLYLYNFPLTAINDFGTYEIWQAQKFTPADINPPLGVPNKTLEGGDWDGDGIVNLLEYAFNLEPKNSAPSQFQFSLINNYFALKYRKNKNPGDLQFEIQTSTNLVNWTTEVFNNTTQPIDPQTDLVTATDPLPVSGNKFFRLKITKTGMITAIANLSPSFAVPSTITVTKSGLGTVTSAHINCGPQCAVTNFGATSSETLTAQPSSEYQFDGWSGACTGNANCELNFSTSKTVQATFSPVPPSSGDSFVSLCYKCRTISVPFYLRARYIANGGMDGTCSDTCR